MAFGGEVDIGRENEGFHAIISPSFTIGMNRPYSPEDPTDEHTDPSPGIRLPRDPQIVRLLDAKYQSYRERRARQRENGDQQGELDSFYKMTIIAHLFNDGCANFSAIATYLRVHYGLDEALFQNACAVIEDYIATGGRNTVRKLL